MAKNNIITGQWNNTPGIKQSGGGGHSGGGGFDDMEPRISALETHVEYIRRDAFEIKSVNESIRSDITDARVKLSQLGERISHLPTKGFIVTALFTALAIISALITFHQQIQRLLH
jgi:hypothetical protein